MMKISTALIAIFLSTLLMFPIISIVRAEDIEEPTVTVNDVATNEFSSYNITATTADGGKIEYLFIWQRGIHWGWFGEEDRYVFDTPPILQMSKYFKNGTLDCSITYTPLFLLQYNDTNDNGLFDFWTREHREFSEEIEDKEIEWEALRDRIYNIYSLAPIFHFRQQRSWNWSVSKIDESKAPNEYSWSISATIPALLWFRAFGGEQTTIHVSFGYHVRLLPENPEVKYDFKFSDITWANGKNMKLAMMSAIQYYSKETPVVQVGTKSFYGFHETEKAWVPRFTIQEEVTNAVKAFVSYSPDATIDGVDRPNVVESALQPLFFIPTPFLIPEGVYVRGITPGMRLRPIWRHCIAFAHQLGLPHFDDYVSQDPVIGLATTLATIVPPPVTTLLPEDLLPLQAIIAAAIIVTVAVAAAYHLQKRRIAAPISAPKL